jgi:hypothetical protein
MFGNLIEVSSPALIERYNRALKELTGKITSLTDFHVDISGYSPEVGDELGDHQYLNEGGVNRQFILLTTQQKTAPLLNAKFSMSRGILRDFIEENESQLFALTARDAVAGELVNSVIDVSDPKRLFDVRQIKIEADTPGGQLAQARKLSELVDTFRKDKDAWYDDVLIAEMIGIAKDTGDITRNPVTLKTSTFRQDNMWTSHFGGLYIFRSVEHPAAITVSDSDLGQLPIPYQFPISKRNMVAKFLELNNLVEPIVSAKGIDAAAILYQKMDFILVDVATAMKEDVTGATRRDLRQLARRYVDQLPPAYHALNALVRWTEGNGGWPQISSDHDGYFYSLRSKPHEDRDLVNMLLAELTPLDVRQLFICHKQLFYSHYARWSDNKKDFVADFLDREYQMDKVGTREALFGGEDAMEEPGAHEPDLIDRVGPWGAVRRR